MTACHQVGDRIALHMYSCTSPEQHRRAVVRGTIYGVHESRSPKYPGMVAEYYTAILDTGERVQLGPGDWSEAHCPNAQAVTVPRHHRGTELCAS